MVVREMLKFSHNALYWNNSNVTISFPHSVEPEESNSKKRPDVIHSFGIAALILYFCSPSGDWPPIGNKPFQAYTPAIMTQSAV